MLVSRVCVVNNGTINGHVHHKNLTKIRMSPDEYTLSMDRHGKTYHDDAYRILPVPEGFETAGQDVYGYTEKSIVLADGHGPNGTDVAIKAVAMARKIESIPFKSLDSSTEGIIRRAVVRELKNCTDMRSGATFVQMLFHEYGSRRWVITVNVGDSEALLVEDNMVHVCSVAHNWDNSDVYRRYFQHSVTPMPVCYNRWNAGKYKLKDMNGNYNPIMVYDGDKVNMENAKYVSKVIERKKPGFKYGTQSIRMPSSPHENWGSSVLIDGKARGQMVATYGDQYERVKTGAPYEMVHVYIREISGDVTALVQSDGLTSRVTLNDCGLLSGFSARNYIESVSVPCDDMSVVIAHWTMKKTTTPYPTK
jgi:hypothetical protein